MDLLLSKAVQKLGSAASELLNLDHFQSWHPETHPYGWQRQRGKLFQVSWKKSARMHHSWVLEADAEYARFVKPQGGLADTTRCVQSPGLLELSPYIKYTILCGLWGGKQNALCQEHLFWAQKPLELAVNQKVWGNLSSLLISKTPAF